MATVTTWHYLYLVAESNQKSYYFQGFLILLLACSLMIFKRKMLIFYFVTTLPLATFVALKAEGGFPRELQVLNLYSFSLFLIGGAAIAARCLRLEIVGKL